MKIKYLRILFSIVVITLASCSTTVKINSQDNTETVLLPDGSVAFLNKNSTIEYKENFRKRIVKQNGEVFFEVEKGESPFIVKTETGEILVLGTKFNVRSENKDLEVDVEEGIVELKIDKLIKKVKKGQKAVFRSIENNIRITKAELSRKKWVRDMERDFRKLGKVLEKDSKKLGKELKKLGKEVNKDLKEFQKNLNN